MPSSPSPVPSSVAAKEVETLSSLTAAVAGLKAVSCKPRKRKWSSTQSPNASMAEAKPPESLFHQDLTFWLPAWLTAAACGCSTCRGANVGTDISSQAKVGIWSYTASLWGAGFSSSLEPIGYSPVPSGEFRWPVTNGTPGTLAITRAFPGCSSNLDTHFGSLDLSNLPIALPSHGCSKSKDAARVPSFACS